MAGCNPPEETGNPKKKRRMSRDVLSSMQIGGVVIKRILFSSTLLFISFLFFFFFFFVSLDFILVSRLVAQKPPSARTKWRPRTSKTLYQGAHDKRFSSPTPPQNTRRIDGDDDDWQAFVSSPVARRVEDEAHKQ